MVDEIERSIDHEHSAQRQPTQTRRRINSYSLGVFESRRSRDDDDDDQYPLTHHQWNHRLSSSSYGFVTASPLLAVSFCKRAASTRSPAHRQLHSHHSSLVIMSLLEQDRLVLLQNSLHTLLLDHVNRHHHCSPYLPVTYHAATIHYSSVSLPKIS